MRRRMALWSAAAVLAGSAGAEVRATLVGHATVLLESEAGAVLTDPYWGTKILGGLKRRIPPSHAPEELPPVDLMLVSHTHPDHFDLGGMARVPGEPTVIVPWKRGRAFRKRGFRVVEMRPGDVHEEKGVGVRAIRARHMWGHCLGYVVTLGGRKIYFPGDTKLFKGLTVLKAEKIDLMLLPYGGAPVFGSIWTTQGAVEAVRRVAPRAVVPVHWGTFARWWTKKEPLTPETFVERVRREVPETRAWVLRVGEVFRNFDGETSTIPKKRRSV